MDLTMGVLVSRRRYQRLLGGAGPEADAVWRLQAIRQEGRYGVRTLVLPAEGATLEASLVRGAVAAPDGWMEAEVPPPTIYHNLLLCPPAAEARALRALNGDLRATVFNETNRWRRGLVCDILAAVPATAGLIPLTLPYSEAALDACLDGGGPALLAPSRRSLRQALILEWQPDGRLRVTRPHTGMACAVARAELPGALAGLLPAGQAWLSALGAWPAGPAGPVEWRLYAHRGEDGAWTLGGAVAKRDLFRLGRRPERCWELEAALALTFGAGAAPALGSRLREAALAVVQALSLYLPGIAHCAVDFWITADGRLLLADLIGRYRTDWLRRIGDLPALVELLDHPVRFARLLAQMGVGKLHVGFGAARPAGGAGGAAAAGPVAAGG